MSDKSPRESTSKKPGKSIKEKRAIKKSKRSAGENTQMEDILRGKPGTQRA
jgi:hypothetical protein